MAKRRIIWTRTTAGRYENESTGFVIRKGERSWFVYDSSQPGVRTLVGSGATLSAAKVAAAPLVTAKQMGS